MRCESPIEEMMYEGLVGPLGCERWHGDPAGVTAVRPMAFVFPQHEIGPYRVDFLVAVAGPAIEPYRLVIECDGRQFHSGREQIIHDQRREREICDLGYEVVRFSGTAIYGSLFDCLDVIRGRLEERGVECKERPLWHFFSGGALDGNISRQRWKDREQFWREQEDWRRWRDWRDGEPSDAELGLEF